MKAYLQRMYNLGKLNDFGLDAAVSRGWVTQADIDDIRTPVVTEEPVDPKIVDPKIVDPKIVDPILP